MNNRNNFEEFTKHLIEDKKPSLFFNKLIKIGEYPDYKPYDRIYRLKEVQQSPKYHPEGNVWNHTMLVVDHAANIKQYSKDSLVFMWSALLHDVGKYTTTRVIKKRITSYNHDTEGEKIAGQFLKSLTINEQLIDNVKKMVRWHMQPLFVIKKLPFAMIEEMVRDISISELALLSICDRLGRGQLTKEKVEEEKKLIIIFIKECMKYLSDKDEIKKCEFIINKLNYNNCVKKIVNNDYVVIF